MDVISQLKEAMFYEKRGDGKVRCQLCAHNCIIGSGNVGVCGVRRNIDGKLYSLIYGKASSISSDPVEKKPLYHFYPGSAVLSFGTVGCNLKCQYCQNWRISQVTPERFKLRNVDKPENIPSLIRKYACDGIAFTYNEPTIWYEFAYEAARIVKERNYYTIFVSNGYMNPEPMKKLAPYLDAINIDLKAFSEKQYLEMSKAKLQPVLDTLMLAKKLGIHIEITTLLVPGFNDSEEEIRAEAEWIRDNLGPEVPLHITRYHPDFQYKARSPTMQELIKALDISKKAGLDYVYLGNIMKTDYENTRCPKCNNHLVKRKTRFVERTYNILDDVVSCPHCQTIIPIVDSRKKLF